MLTQNFFWMFLFTHTHTLPEKVLLLKYRIKFSLCRYIHFNLSSCHLFLLNITGCLGEDTFVYFGFLKLSSWQAIPKSIKRVQMGKWKVGKNTAGQNLDTFQFPHFHHEKALLTLWNTLHLKWKWGFSFNYEFNEPIFENVVFWWCCDLFRKKKKVGVMNSKQRHKCLSFKKICYCLNPVPLSEIFSEKSL